MAEGQDSSQEKTEEATPRRLQKARDDGQIPRSKDLTTSAILLSGSIALFVFGEYMTVKLLNILKYNFSFDREAVFDTEKMVSHLGVSFYEGLLVLMPLFGVLLVASILGPIGLGGWLLSAKAMAPKFNRMSPIAGLKRMFAMKALIELVKSILKVLVVVALALLILNIYHREIISLAYESAKDAMGHATTISGIAAIILSASTLLIVIVDVPFQIWEHAKKLKMSRQDIKDEMKDSEGKPEVKSRIRQLQHEMANNRMMGNVPEADVVITNPTHFAVALRYAPGDVDTPILLAKGADLVAFKIREIAKLHDVEVIESPTLARAVFYTTEVDQEIPEGLYIAVAQVLAYVFQMRQYRKGQGDRPYYPRNIKVPKDMQYDL